jgi:hypothetical protein
VRRHTGTLSEDEITEGMIQKADKLDKFIAHEACRMIGLRV